MNQSFLGLIQNLEDALSDMRGNSIFPNATWNRSAEYYQEHFEIEFRIICNQWSNSPRNLEKLKRLCKDCADHYSRNEIKLGTALATEINALLYRVRTENITE